MRVPEDHECSGGSAGVTTAGPSITNVGSLGTPRLLADGTVFHHPSASTSRLEKSRQLDLDRKERNQARRTPDLEPEREVKKRTRVPLRLHLVWWISMNERWQSMDKADVRFAGELDIDIPERRIFSQMLDIPTTKKLSGELIHVF